MYGPSRLSNEKKSANESARTRLLIRRAYKHLCINIMNLLRMRMRMRMLLVQYWTFVNATIDKGYSQITDRDQALKSSSEESSEDASLEEVVGSEESGESIYEIEGVEQQEPDPAT
ncbi:hypothetical protein HUJ04_000346 [Dendroctonus ponderosae]|nr:hypothetical protein HUJ04_000346 [Dendroctonus ponderosae]